jgi:hypothetical protein
MYTVTIENSGSKIGIDNPNSERYRLVDRQVSEEVNSIPAFSFKIYPNNIGYNSLTGLSTKVTVHDTRTDKDIFIGRVLTVAASMDEEGKICKNVTCEGDLGYLCDTLQESRTFSSGTTSTIIMKSLIDEHNEQVDADKQFTVGECWLTGLPSSTAIDWCTTLEAAKTLLIDTIGGEIRVRCEDGVRYLDFSQRFGNKSETSIKVAVNMKSITQTKDPTGVITRLIPLGGTKSNGKRLTIAASGKSSGSIYIDNEELQKQYGIIVGKVIYDDIVGEGSDEQAAALKLYNKALTYMESMSQEKRQYEITALDLSSIDSSFEEFKLGYLYDVQNSLMDINEELRIIKRTLNLDEPYKSSLTFGDKFETLTGLASKKDNTEALISNAKEEIRKTMQSTVDYITGGNGGYVVQKFNSDGQPIATVYTDNLDFAKAKEMLTINNRGILGTTDGGTTYNTAIDIRGNINASAITAGILSGISIVCNNATITGGKINMKTSAESNDDISLSYNEWSINLSPLQMVLYNSSTGCEVKAQAGGIFLSIDGTERCVYHQRGLRYANSSGKEQFYIDSENGSIVAKDSSGKKIFYFDGGNRSFNIYNEKEKRVLLMDGINYGISTYDQKENRTSFIDGESGNIYCNGFFKKVDPTSDNSGFIEIT